MSKDYYKILGIDKNSSKEEIKKAYKKLAKKYHPDISKEADAEQKFKDVNEAAEILLDDRKKQQYDTYGNTNYQDFEGFGNSGFGNGSFNASDFGINIDDIFEQFGFGGGNGSRSKKQKKDTSIYEEIELNLEDVYHGIEKKIKITHKIKCSKCNGKGAENKKDIKICPTCNGSGTVIELQRSILGSIRTQRPCHTCNGKGHIINNPCSKCNGEGTETKKETITVKIPKGVENGVTLRVSNKGSYDPETDSYGDLYLKIFIKQNNEYDVDGADLYKTINLNFIQAILGDEIEFQHFDKTLSLKIPQGTQPGTILRLKSKGLPYFNYNGNGNLFVKINIEIPTSVTKEQKKILGEYLKTLKDKSFFKRMKNLFS